MLKSINLKSAVVALALGGLIAAPAVSKAGTEEKKPAKDSKNVIEETKKSCITGDLGVNFVSEYIARGLVYQNQGAIAQPYADIYFHLYDGSGFLNSVVLQLGVWSSLHSFTQHTAGESGAAMKNWYEFDYTASIAATFAKNWTATFSYIEADYPGLNGDGSDLDDLQSQPNRNIQLGIAYNDSDLLGAFALHPHFNVLYELVTNTYGAAGIKQGGWYYELGIAPTYTLIKSSPYAVTLTAPVTLGFGDNNGFYDDNVFGYFSIGVNASVPLAFIPSCFGTWTANAGFTYYRLGNTAAQYSKNNTYVDDEGPYYGVTNGSRDQYVFSGGVGMTF